jgi:dynein heavy chain
MNPGYAGRTALPDNLSSLFRPVAMMIPESEMIAEIILQSEGFKDAQVLAKKINTIYSLIDKQLSKQPHYAYGLRAIKSVLQRAGQLNRSKGLDLSEELVLMRALRDMNASKLIAEDIFLFDSLLADVFPSVELPSLDYSVLRGELERQLVAAGLQVHQPLIDKIIQLYESKGTRHGNMLVGSTCSGKSTAWKILARALSALHEARVANFESVSVDVLNPKAITSDELVRGRIDTPLCIVGRFTQRSAFGGHCGSLAFPCSCSFSLFDLSSSSATTTPRPRSGRTAF